MKSEVESDNCRSPGLLREADRCLYQKLIRIEICHFFQQHCSAIRLLYVGSEASDNTAHNERRRLASI